LPHDDEHRRRGGSDEGHQDRPAGEGALGGPGGRRSLAPDVRAGLSGCRPEKARLSHGCDVPLSRGSPARPGRRTDHGDRRADRLPARGAVEPWSRGAMRTVAAERRILVAVVTRATGEWIQAWRERHDPEQARRLPPHTTLGYRVPKLEPEALANQVRHAFAGRVTVQLGGVRAFDNAERTI